MKAIARLLQLGDIFQSIVRSVTFSGIDESSTEISEDHRSPSPATSPATPLAAVTSQFKSNAVAEMQTVSKIGTKRKVPPPDFFASKKKQETDVNKCLIEQSKGLTDLAATIGQALTTQTSPPNVPSVVNNASSCTQIMLSAIGLALNAVAEHARLDCFVGVLQYICEFSKKG